jgi:hypothetical protein
MTCVNPSRFAAVVLIALAFGALAASKAFPFLDDISGLAKTVIAIVGAACVLTGVYLWQRKAPN